MLIYDPCSAKAVVIVCVNVVTSITCLKTGYTDVNTEVKPIVISDAGVLSLSLITLMHMQILLYMINHN